MYRYTTAATVAVRNLLHYSEMNGQGLSDHIRACGKLGCAVLENKWQAIEFGWQTSVDSGIDAVHGVVIRPHPVPVAVSYNRRR